MSPPWMPFYVADYLADTGHLGALEHGAYMLLIMHYWQKGGLPDDDRQLARIARMTDEQFSNARFLLEEFFSDGWRHERIEAELSKAAAKNDRRVQAGRAGGLAKAKRCSSNATSNATSNALASSSQPESSYEDRAGRARSVDKLPSDYPPQAFEIWYRDWPNKVQRGPAERAFERIRRDRVATFAQLCEGVRRYIATKPPDRNWQNPATWLNGKGWLDQPAPQTGLALLPPATDEPRVDFGGGVTWPERTVRAQLDHFRRDPNTWPRDRLGPPPGEPGCRLPAKILEAA